MVENGTQLAADMAGSIIGCHCFWRRPLSRIGTAMKDVSVVVEIAVDDDMSDEAIQVLVETILRTANLRGRTSFEVDPDVIDVVAITDGIFWEDPTPPEWRRLPQTR